MLGTADKVTVSKDYTTIVNGAGVKENIKERCDQINNNFAKRFFDSTFDDTDTCCFIRIVPLHAFKRIDRLPV